MAENELKIKVTLLGIKEQINKFRSQMKATTAQYGSSKDLSAQSGIINRLKRESIEMSKQLESRDAFNTLRNEFQVLNRMGSEIGTNNDLYRTQAARVTQLGNELKLTGSQMKGLQHSTRAFNFEFLTFLFAGMAMQRIFGGALRSIVDNYKKITDMNSEFNKSVLKLNASWNFLKFSIGNALNSPFIINAIDSLIGAVEYMSDVFLDNPWLANALLGVLAALTAFGTLAIGVGVSKQIIMLGEGIAAMWASIKGVSLATKLPKIAAGLDSLKPYVGKVLSITLSLVFTGLAISEFLDIFGDDVTSFTKRLKATALAGLAGASVGFAVAGLPGVGLGFMLGVGVGFVLNMIDFIWEGFRQDVKKEFSKIPSLGEGGANREILADMGQITPIVDFQGNVLDTAEIVSQYGSAWDDLTKATEEFQQKWDQDTKLIERADEVERLKQQLTDMSVAQILSGVEVEKMTMFDNLVLSLKENLPEMIIDFESFLNNLLSFNETVNTTNDSLELHIDVLDREIEKYDALSDSIDKATEAKRRYASASADARIGTGFNTTFSTPTGS